MTEHFNKFVINVLQSDENNVILTVINRLLYLKNDIIYHIN